MVQSRGVHIRAPSKINLHLAIGEKRPDGFHNLESIFVVLDFADTLIFHVLPGQGGRMELAMSAEGPCAELARLGQIFPPIPPEENLVYRAAALFRAETGYSGNMAAELIKRIPPGSGLGGGSSDAAATLLALNYLAAKDHEKNKKCGILSRRELLDMALRLGSDVPFFIEIAGLQSDGLLESPVCIVTGRGEHIQSLAVPPPLGVLLAFPGFGSNTGRAYSIFDRQNSIPVMNRPAALSRILNSIWPPPETWDFYNDFEKLFLCNGTGEEKTRYSALLAELQKGGASFAGLSGSGSTCFGIFSDPEGVEAVKNTLNGDLSVFQTTFFLRPPESGSTLIMDLS